MKFRNKKGEEMILTVEQVEEIYSTIDSNVLHIPSLEEQDEILEDAWYLVEE